MPCALDYRMPIHHISKKEALVWRQILGKFAGV